jgi:TrpR family trp operon transcriptional repressor
MTVQQWSKVVDLIQTQSDHETLNSVLGVLLTPEERDAVASRLAIMRALLNGGESQREISARFDVSIAKVSRCSNFLKRLETHEKQLIEIE